jgi:CubicO group peptidase (beta-lactamase class C family)/uncharacterized protein (DUF302 family)
MPSPATTPAPFPTDGRGNPKVAHLGQSVDQMIYDFMEERQIPGLTLAIVQAPYITRVVGYGLSDIGQKRLASSKTVWATGPISQGYAAVAIMQLVEQRKLNLNDKASRYLPDLPAAWKDITILQLLQHASGIADYRAQGGYDASKKQSPRDLIAMVKDQPLAFAPGTDVAQSPTNFLLLAQIVEKASGSTYRDFVTKNQIEALGLRHTLLAEDIPKLKEENVAASGGKHKDFLKDRALIDPIEHATGYSADLSPTSVSTPAALKGFSDIWASAEDISLWDIGLAGSLLIAKSENRAIIYHPTTLDNGKVVPCMAGWEFYHHKGLMDIKGNAPGFSSHLSRFTDPSELLCVTLLANKEGIDLSNLARRIASAFDNSLQSGGDDRNLFLRESAFGVDETMARIEAELKKRNIPVFARFDHAQNAKEANLEMRPTRVIVFGSPAVGTLMMQAEQSISLELPLRISVWQDAKGSVWVAFPQMNKMAAIYGQEGNPIVYKMQSLMEGIADKACSAY